MASSVIYRSLEEVTCFSIVCIYVCLRAICGRIGVFVRNVIHSQAALVFPAGSSVAGLNSQRVKEWMEHSHRVLNTSVKRRKVETGEWRENASA
jgi:hypothetical protein